MTILILVFFGSISGKDMFRTEKFEEEILNASSNCVGETSCSGKYCMVRGKIDKWQMKSFLKRILPRCKFVLYEAGGLLLKRLRTSSWMIENTLNNEHPLTKTIKNSNLNTSFWMQSVTSAIMHDNLIFTTPAWTFYKSSVIFLTLREWLGVNLSGPSTDAASSVLV